MKRKITKQAVIHAKKIITLYERQEKTKSGVGIYRNISSMDSCRSQRSSRHHDSNE